MDKPYNPDEENRGKIFEIILPGGETLRAVPKVELYSVIDFMGKKMPGLALTLCPVDPESGKVCEDEYTALTVSFGEFIGRKNAAYIDVNNNPFYGQILTGDIAKNTGLIKHSGFCVYPLYVFSEDFLKSCGGENYQTYSDAYDEYMRAAFSPYDYEDEEETESCSPDGMSMENRS